MPWRRAASLSADARFVRDDDDDQGDQGASGASWEDRVARNYEAKLFREYALVSTRLGAARGCGTLTLAPCAVG